MRVTLALWLLLTACGTSQTAATPATTPPTEVATGEEAHAQEAPTANPRAFLWVVEGETAPSYLLGTMHIGVSLDGTLNDAQQQAFQSSSVVVLEMDKRAVNQTEMQAAFLYPPGAPGLQTRLSPTTWSGLRAALHPVPAENLDRMTPMAALVTLETVRIQRWQVAESGLGGIEPGMDSTVHDRAQARGAELVFLETPSEQIALLSGMDEQVVISELDAMVEEPDPMREASEMVSAYRSGHEAHAMAILLEDIDDPERGPYYEKLIFERNERWVAPLLPLLRHGGAFVAVGLGHMLGERGLPELLRAEGLSVRRWSPSDS